MKKITISSGKLVVFLTLLIIMGIIYTFYVPRLISYTIPKYPGIAYGDFRYLQDGDGATIVGYTGAGGAITIPENVNGLPVTRIGAGVFSKKGLYYYSSLPEGRFCSCDPSIKLPIISSVILPQSLQYIDDFSFEGSEITQIQIPKNVIYIGYLAFGAVDLGSVDIPGNVKTIEARAFANCNLKTVTLEDGIETINHDAFSNDSDYYSYQLQNTIQSFNIPASVTKIESPIANNPEFLNYIVDSNSQTYSSIDDGLLLNKTGNAIISCPSGKTGDLVMPSSVQTSDISKLGDAGVFGGCDKITSILFKSTNTFLNKDALKDITYCSYYKTKDHFSVGNDPHDTDTVTVTDAQGVVYNKTKDMLISCPHDLKGSYVIPNGVTTIGDFAFDDCKNITSISMPNTITTVGKLAFTDCNNLNNINIPTSVTTIGDYAFNGSWSLRDITIPSSVTNFGSKIFDSSVHNTVVHGETGSKIESYIDHYSVNPTTIAFVDFTTSPKLVNYWGIAMQGAILFVYVIMALVIIILVLIRIRTYIE